MRTREVVSQVKKFRDYYGFDIPQAPVGVDKFIRELGIEWEGI